MINMTFMRLLMIMIVMVNVFPAMSQPVPEDNPGPPQIKTIKTSVFEKRRGRSAIRYEFYAAYDTSGNLIEHRDYKKKGEIRDISFRRYDDKHHLLDLRLFDSDNKYIRRYGYTYDTAGHMTETLHHESDSTQVLRTRLQYDSRGNKTEEISYKSDGTIYWRYVFAYDESSRKIDETAYSGYYGQQLQHRYTFQFNGQGSLTENKRYDYSGLEDSVVYMYNDQEKLLDMTTFSADGKIQSCTTYRYDMRGNQVEMKHYISEMLIDSTTYSYDLKGNKIKVNYENGSKAVFEYDDSGRVICEKLYDWKGELYDQSITRYDNDGRVILEKNSGGPFPTLKWKYKYNKSSKLRRKTTSNVLGLISYKLSYTYDKHSNWIKCVEYQRWICFKVTTRKFEYYD